MHINHIAIRNFKALTDIDCDLNPRVNVIVGPNAVGKTTILQAIRLTKALLAPRLQNETQQVLVSLGAASPHFPQRMFLNGLAGSPGQPIEIRNTYVLSKDELATLRTSLREMVQNIVAARAGLTFSNPALLIQFLNSEQGKNATTETTSEVTTELERIERDKSVVLGVTMHALTGQIIPANPLAGPLIGFLDQRLRPSLSIFSYFPADRALPMGETNLQLGAPDAQQQLESHNSQPQLKYTRLKNLIINSLIFGTSQGPNVRGEFETIFSELLKGRKINTIGTNHLGLFSIMTEEISTGKLIELDILSSGEKNIALTFLILSTSVADGGIVLFDEPELHLNPAVSREILSFVMDRYSMVKNMQFIMCTHSPEILSGAFSNDDCNLMHLKSATDITRVGKRALEEYADALHKLGTSVGETLFYEGTVLVQGGDDVSFLETGFADVFRRYRIKDLGGRREVEKTIREIQALEQRGETVAPIYLIFDHDDEPTKLQNTIKVKLLQWPRRCMENYMIDGDVIAELLRDPSITKSPITSEGEVHRLLRDTAFKQLDAIAAREIYESYQYLNATISKRDLKDHALSELADFLFERMSQARASMPETTKAVWTADFQGKAEGRRRGLLPTWEAKWKELCDGKRFISDLHKAADLRISESAFKTRITQRMRDTGSETWHLVKAILEDFVRPSP